MARLPCSFGTTRVENSESLPARSSGIARTRGKGKIACAHRAIGRLTLLAVMNAALSVLSFGGDTSSRRPDTTGRVAEIPFKAYEGYLIVVEGRIGNFEHQNLLLDTGSNPSMIGRSVAAKLGLQGASRDLAFFNKSVATESVVLPDLQFGPMRRQNLPVLVADFSAIGGGMGTRIDAVIGLDVLGATSFTVDYAKQRIGFAASVERHTVPFTAGPQFITVNLKSGGRELHLLVDTGTAQLVLFESHLRGFDYVWTGVFGSGKNPTGNVPFKAVILPRARIGTFEVGPQQASVVATQRAIGKDLDGLMGISCLRPKRISFDFEQKLLGWSN